jgi:hypothetical protein
MIAVIMHADEREVVHAHTPSGFQVTTTVPLRTPIAKHVAWHVEDTSCSIGRKVTRECLSYGP